MIDRRTFIATSAIVILGAPLVVEAQREGKVPRIGVLLTGPPPRENVPTPTIDAFRQGLREHGYVEGQNVAIEWRWAGERPDQLPDLATELVRLRVDLIGACPGIHRLELPPGVLDRPAFRVREREE